MKTLSPVLFRLDEDLAETLHHIRTTYAWDRMSIEEHEQVMAVYLALDKLSTQLLDGTLDH